MSPKDLEKLAKVCQKYGITYIRTDLVELKLESIPQASIKPAQEASKEEPALTDEDIAFWSASA